MEEEKKEQEVEKPVEHQPVSTKKDPFSLFGKIAAVVIIIVLLVGGGVYAGMVMRGKTVTPTPTPLISQAPGNNAQGTMSPTATPTAAMVAQTKTVSAGMSGDATSFKPYSLQVPTGWTDSQVNTDISNKLTLTKDSYSLSIYQAPMGGGGCLYPADADSEMAQRFTDFEEITGANGTFRISWNKTGNPPGTISYTVCQKSTDSFGSPTSFGAISVKSPDPADKSVMDEIKAMISSLKKP